MKKRMLAVLLSACMLAAAVPYPVFAADTAAASTEETAAEEEPSSDGEAGTAGSETAAEGETEPEEQTESEEKTQDAEAESDTEERKAASAADNFKYTTDDSGVTITKYTGSESSVVIPDQIDGKYVVEIGSYAFFNQTNLSSVTLPDHLVSIGTEAFYKTNLEEVTLPDSLTTIESWAFEGCKKLKSVRFSENLTEIGNGAFEYTNLEEVTLPDSLTKMYNSAFSDCENLKSVTLSRNLTSINSSVFAWCQALSKISIPASVSQIDNSAFEKCSSLTSIEVDQQNPYYTSLDGILYNKDQTKLLLCPAGREGSIRIAGRVTDIEKGAFSYCEKLTGIEVDKNNAYYSSQDGVLYNKDQTKLVLCPAGKSGSLLVTESVTEIGSGAFQDSSLSSVIILKSVTSIASDAFRAENYVGRIYLKIYGYTDSYAQTYAKENDITFVNVEEKPIDIYISGDTDTYWVKDGERTDSCPDEVTYDAQTNTLTLNGYANDSSDTLHVDGYFDALKNRYCDLTVNLVGTNTISKMYAGYTIGKITFSGDGTLNANRIDTDELVINSGTYNLEYSTGWETIYTKDFTMNGGTLNIHSSDGGYGMNSAYGYVSKENEFRFLGGTVNVTGNFFCAIDAQSGNIEVRNASINIEQTGEDCTFGLVCGQESDGKNYGGNLTLENADINIRSTAGDGNVFSNYRYYFTYFFKLNDVSGNHSYYSGTGALQYKQTFDDAIDNESWRYDKSVARSLGNKINYFSISTKDKKLAHTPTFKDVTDAASSYYDPIYWAADKGITTGYSDGTFGVSKNCTRGAFVTFLWRQQGSPDPTLTAEKSGLKDFNSIGKSYQKAVLWAVEKGITTGYKDKTFRASAKVTRGAAVTFLWRAAGKPKVSITRDDVDFTDMVSAGSSYETGILWAVENKITTGYSNHTFRPANNCTRGATVTFLKRFDDLK